VVQKYVDLFELGLVIDLLVALFDLVDDFVD